MYTIILKIKEGELIALQQNHPSEQTRVILEALQTPSGFRVEKHLRNVIAAGTSPASIGLDYHAQQIQDLGSFEGLVAQIPSTDRAKIAPVLHLQSGKSAFASAISHADLHSGQFYLRATALTHYANPAEEALELIESKGFDPSRVRLIVDFGDIHDASVYEDWFGRVGVPSAIHSPFADVSIAATSYPGSISKIDTGWTKFTRHEMRIWQAYTEGRGCGLHFCDYGCRSTAFPPPPKKFSLPVLAQLRYTLDQEYLIYRGNTLKSDRRQHFGIGAEMIRRQEFFGADFSWGDLNLVSLAQGVGGPRGRGQIIAYETAHHLLATEVLLAG